MADIRNLYDPTLDAWPELRQQTVILAPVRVGMDRRTGRMIVGWKHVVQSMGVIFATRYHERVLRRHVGCLIPHMLGESGTERNITHFYFAIASALDLWEPNYGLQRVRVSKRSDTGEAQELTSTDNLRRGELMTRNEGTYRPRGHLGDFTEENRRSVGLVGVGLNRWEEAK